MTNTATKTYLVGVIERAIAYYEVEAEDARTAAENWQDGEYSDRDDEALESEGPCSVREQRPDGTWRKVPPSEWEWEEPATDAAPELQTQHTREPWLLDGFTVVNPNATLRKDRHDAKGGAIADIGGLGNPTPGEQKANARRIVAAVNACAGIPTEALERGLLRSILESLQRAEFLMRRVSDGDHRALENLRSAADQALAVLAQAAIAIHD